MISTITKPVANISGRSGRIAYYEKTDTFKYLNKIGMYKIQADLLQTSSSATLYLSTPPSQTTCVDELFTGNYYI